MTDFPLHTPETAPEGSAEALRGIRRAWGFVPNLHAELAEAPAALEGYAAVFDAFSRSSFTPVEQQVVYLAINYENECAYCMAGHSALAAKAGVPAGAIEAIREGQAVADPRLEALRRFAAAMTAERGHVGAAAVERFLAAGFTEQQVLEVILAISAKTLSNYTNHLAATPLDPFMTATAWTHPASRADAA